jgi:hypothetical protein
MFVSSVLGSWQHAGSSRQSGVFRRGGATVPHLNFQIDCRLFEPLAR